MAGTAKTRKRATTATKAAAEKAAAQNAIYAPPWLLLIAVGVVGQLAHVLWGDALLGRVGIIACTLAVACTSWQTSAERSLPGRLYPVVTVLLAGAWLALASSTGLLAMRPVADGDLSIPWPVRPTFDLFVLVGFSAAFVWNQRQGTRLTEAAAAELRGELDEWADVGLPGLRVQEKRRNPVRTEVTFILPRGITLEDLQKRAREVEQVRGWPRKSLSISEHPSKASRKARGVVMHSDPLAEPVTWPGLEQA